MPPMDMQASMQAWISRQPGYASATIESLRTADGGASNVTYRVGLVDAPFAAIALRLQGERGIFEPYDVLREGRVLRALEASPIPVPRVLQTEPDASILGAPFVAMEWVEAPHMGEAGPMASFPAFTSMVAQIHALDWRALDLEFLGVPEHAAAGTAGDLDVWEHRMGRFPGADNSALRAALIALRESIPEDGELSLCHGDINVFNYLFLDQRVASVVDWEEARLGDRRYDVGQLVALGHLKGTPFGPAGDQGFVRAYQQAAGVELVNMEFFRALWLFQLGVIYYGWVEYGGSEPWYSWPEVTDLLAPALAEL